MDIDVDMTIDRRPDEVWPLIATGDGLSRWFVPTTVDPGPDGSVTVSFVQGEEHTIPMLEWENGRLLAFGQPGARTMQLSVEPAPGGARVTVRDGGVPDEEADATRDGWRDMLTVLKDIAESDEDER